MHGGTEALAREAWIDSGRQPSFLSFAFRCRWQRLREDHGSHLDAYGDRDGHKDEAGSVTAAALLLPGVSLKDSRPGSYQLDS